MIPASTKTITWLTGAGVAILASQASAATISFGPTGGAPVTIPNSGGTTYTSSLIWGGTAGMATHEDGTGGGTGGVSGTAPGTNPANVGGTYDGTFFDPNIDGDPTAATVIASTRREDIDDDGTVTPYDYANYIGICINFSAPIEAQGFGFVDLDLNEWVASFGYNSATTTTVIPNIGLGSAGDLLQEPASTTVSFPSITGAPTTYPVAYNDTATGGLDPDDPKTQVSFQYGGAEVTDLYFVWGLRGDWTGNRNQNNASGVTGLLIPEPSRAVLMAMGIFALVLRRRR